MVFKPFTHLARQSLGKTFTHGYAQSVVAATQSSYASSTTPFGPFGNHAVGRLSKHGSSQVHTTFQAPPNSSASNTRSSHGVVDDATNNDGGLTAYYEAWQKLQQQQQHDTESKEWRQFQFARRIGWNPPSVVQENRKKGKEEISSRSDGLVERGGIERAYSTGAVDDIKKAEDVIAEATAIVEVDEAIAKEISSHQKPPESLDVVQIAQFTNNDQKQLEAILDEASSHKSLQSGDTIRLSTPSSESSNTLAAINSHEHESQILSEHLSKLSATLRYDEIPPIFESMLVRGLQPSAKAYNALLDAAINITIARHQIVPKALDIYTDMLRRKVVPDVAFYTSFIQLLSRRAIEVFQMKREMETKSLRCGRNQEERTFLFRSDEIEYNILAEDDAVNTAMKIFVASNTTVQGCSFSPDTYRLLVTACALYSRIEDMICAFSHMETHGVTPLASMFPPMIEAFATSGDLGSAVECYNEYKALAIANNSGEQVVMDRHDIDVYAAVVKAYATCGKTDGANKFLSKVIGSYDNVTEYRKERLEEVQDTIIPNALVQDRLERRDFGEAFRLVEERSLTPSARARAMAHICSAAADHGNASIAAKAYQYVQIGSPDASKAATSMLAFYIRQGNVEQARDCWSILESNSVFGTSLIQPTAMYAAALIRIGSVDEALLEVRRAFARIRASTINGGAQSDVAEEVDEAIEMLGTSLVEQGIVPSAPASVSLLWTMVENGGLVSPVSEQVLSYLEPESFGHLNQEDLCLTLRVQAEMISNGTWAKDPKQLSIFEEILNLVFQGGNSINALTSSVVEQALQKISDHQPDISSKWYSRIQNALPRSYTPPLDIPATTMSIATTYNDAFDPYAATTDFRGSNIISDQLDNSRSRDSESLDESLIRFKNMRRAGRHPRYIVYAKLINAAAKEGRVQLIHDIIGMARQDVPFLPKYPLVQHGWASILDSMIGACLTLGERSAASSYHQDLLNMGSAPTANTFGLYITTLKDSTKTFDEATEAVKIFHRAKSEGVEPSSFLYNALIGKLGKARRIDDCLFYFAEMRSLGIRPTSVTYGTIVNALCRVSDERFAEELFDEMESMPNYKPRPAPYNSLMQFFLTTKRDSQKVLNYYNRMLTRNIQPTMHTYKLLIDTHATLDPVNLAAAEGVLDTIQASGQRPEAVHYASLIHAKGCALHDVAAARQTFDEVMANPGIRPQACLYQALFESLVANHLVTETNDLLGHMGKRRVSMTPYIANTLIHGWALDRNITKAKAVYDDLGKDKREPSTYEAMTRAFLSADHRESALEVVREMLSRGYPLAVSSKILELLNYGASRASSVGPQGATT
ncbi:MAG: hypothetical protein Q9190_006973 [Brigantiaea leucoxantha]